MFLKRKSAREVESARRDERADDQGSAAPRRAIAGRARCSSRERPRSDRALGTRVEPSFEMLRELVRACGFELNVSIGPAEVDEAGEKVLRRKLRLSPQERFQELLKASRK